MPGGLSRAKCQACSSSGIECNAPVRPIMSSARSSCTSFISILRAIVGCFFLHVPIHAAEGARQMALNSIFRGPEDATAIPEYLRL